MATNRGVSKTDFQKAAIERARNNERVRRARERKSFKDAGADVPADLEAGVPVTGSVSSTPLTESPAVKALVGNPRAMIPLAPDQEQPVHVLYRLIGEESLKEPKKRDIALIAKLSQAFNSTAGGLLKMQNIFTGDDIHRLIDLVEPDLRPETAAQVERLLIALERRRGMG